MVTRALASRLQSLFSSQFGGTALLVRTGYYAVALLAVAAALGTTLLLNPLLQQTPSALFFVAVMLSSWSGGLGPGLLATLCSTVAISHFFLEVPFASTPTNSSTVVQLAVFALAALLISFLNQTRKAAMRQAEINLQSWRDSESRFGRLAAANIIGTVEANLDGTLTEANDAFLQMVGYSRMDLLTGQLCWSVLIAPDYQQVNERAQQALRRTGACPPFEQVFVHQDGARVPVLLGLVRQGATNVTGFVLDLSEAKRNETERLRAEAALRENEERLRLALIAANQGLYDLNVQTGETIVSSEYARMLDDDPARFEETNARWLERMHPDDVATVSQTYQNYVSGELESYRVEFRQRTQTGGWKWILSVGKIVAWDSQGHPLRMLGTHTDITERKQAEADLQIAEERLRLALTAAHAIVWDWDIQTNHIICSQNAEAAWGIQIGSLSDFVSAIYPEDQPMIAQAAAEAQRTGLYLCEYRVLGSDGVLRWLHSRGQTYFDATGQAQRIIGVSLDISERVRIEAERDALLQQEQTAREEAERANQIKDEFLAVLSHELRSPLNPILGWTKLLQSRQFDPEKTTQALATIERNARLQSQLIEDLLDVSRILQGKMVLDMKPVNLATIIEAAIEIVRLSAVEKAVPIQTSLQAERIIVVGDAARLQQIVWNLLTNAVKFTPSGGRIEVRTDVIGNEAQIQVTDTGKGIRAEFLPYVFDCFRQEDGATTRKFGGLGLGLSIVQHLTEQHGGRVSVDSAGEGLGSTFTVSLPIQNFDLEVTEEWPSAKVQNLNHLKILVVDDEADMRELMLAVLETQQAQVRIASSATEALAILKQWQPEVLISDIGMPDMDGYMLMRQVRSLSPEQCGDIPAIALTAYAGEIDQQQSLAAGFQRHLAKPTEPAQLVDAIQQVIKHQIEV